MLLFRITYNFTSWPKQSSPIGCYTTLCLSRTNYLIKFKIFSGYKCIGPWLVFKWGAFLKWTVHLFGDSVKWLFNVSSSLKQRLRRTKRFFKFNICLHFEKSHITWCKDKLHKCVLLVCGKQQFGQNNTPHTNRFRSWKTGVVAVKTRNIANLSKSVVHGR